MAISRKGNVGNEHAPASSPAVAHRRAKRTEWRMRGIEPNNKRNVVFPSSVLPSRRFGNPPSPEGEGLTGHRHVVISSVSREIPRVRNVARAPAPARLPAVALRREIPCKRNENNRTQKHQILVRAGSAPYAGSAPREKEIAAYEKPEYSSRYDLKRKHEKQIS